MSQNTAIIRHCKKDWLTAMEALIRYDCNSLSSRICEIQRKGYAVDKEWIKLRSGKRVIQYRISGGGK